MSTENCHFFHLKNGNVLSWSDSYDTLGRKCSKTGEDRLDLLPVTFPKKLKIINLSCGKRHCIAKSDNNQIYTWGSNSLGQVLI